VDPTGLILSRPPGHGGAVVVTSPFQISPVGQIASLSELAASSANQRALRAPKQKYIEKPAHRLPNDGPTSPVSDKTLQNLRPTPGAIQLSPDNAAPSGKSKTGADIAVTVATGFIGATTNSNLTDGASELEPPDQGLAAANGTVFEIINNTVMLFDSAGTSLLGPVATDVFFGIGHPGNDEFFESDPQVFYDPFVGRWIVTELICTGGSICGGSNTGFQGFAVAVSKTSDPQGGYYIYHVRAFGFSGLGCFTSTDASTCLPDFPKGGYNRDGFFITADMFTNFGAGGFANAVTYALPIQKLINGQSFNYNAWVLTNSNGVPTGDFVIQPSIPAFNEGLITTNGGTEFMMEARNIIDGTHNVRVIAVWNTANIGSGAVNIAWTDINPGMSYGPTVSATEPNVPGPLCTLYGQGAPKLDAGYNSFTANIVVANGDLVGILPFGALDGNGFARNVLDLNIINPGFNPANSPPVQPTTVAAGILQGANGTSTLYPTLAINSANKTGGIGMTFVGIASPGGAGNLFPSILVAPFTYSTSPFGFTLLPLYGSAGAAADDGFTGCTGGGVGRWGDYGMATVDTATGHFWFGNEKIPYPTEMTDGQLTNWGTYITQIGLQ
jgi:hypothetical protein